MGYEIHIVRNQDWWNEDVGGGISLDEWKAYLETDGTMRLDNVAEANLPDGQAIRYENQGLAVWTDHSAHDESGNKAWFDFREGRIIVKNPDREIFRKMHEIATQLNAMVLGDEGEEYDGNGEVVDVPDGKTPSKPHKPWWRIW